MVSTQQDPSLEITDLDSKRQEQAKEYARIRRRYMLLDLALGAILLLAWLLSGLSINLRNWIIGWTSSPWLAVLAFGAIFGGVFAILDLPLSYYTGYILPRRFKQSNQDLKGWVTDTVKGFLISILLGGLILEGIYYLLRSSPGSWWLWAGGFLLLFNVLLSSLAPILLFPIFNKFTPLGEEDQDLKKRLLDLAEQAGLPVMGVFRFDMSRRTKSANAGLTGLGNTRRIILGDTLLDEFTPDEIETVLAHELGHHAHNDIPFSIIVGSGITLSGLYLTSVVLDWGITIFDFQSTADLAALPLFAICLGFYSLLTTPLSNGISRWRENLADTYALQLTGNSAAYASALRRLSDQNLADADPPVWVELLLHSHPALNKRIQRAENYANQ